jgi:hypothetical protein
MTISTSSDANYYTGTGSIATYAYGFKIFDKTDLRVIRQDTNEVETVLVVDLDYTVTGVGAASGGNVVLSSNLALNYKLCIRRARGILQDTSVTNQGTYYPETHEKSFDKLTMATQRVKRDADRSIKILESEDPSGFTLTLPKASSRASKVVGFDASGNAIVVSNVPTSGVSASAFMQTVLDDADAATARATLGVPIAQIFQARLSLSSGIAVSDVAAQGTIYLMPFRGDKIALWDGTYWQLFTLTEISIAVPAVANQMYDLFVFNNSGTPALEALAWTNDTTRATSLTFNSSNGIYTKTGDQTRRYAGSFRTISAGQCSDTTSFRHLWNYHNRVRRSMVVKESTNGWNYTTLTWRQANANTANQLDFVTGVQEDFVHAIAHASCRNTNSGVDVYVGIGIDSTSANSANLAPYATTPAAGINIAITAIFEQLVTVGRHTLVWLEQSAATGTTTWNGDAGSVDLGSGIHGYIFG